MARSRSILTRRRQPLEKVLIQADQEGNLRVWKRVKVVLAYAAGVSVTDICHTFGVSCRTVFNCWERYQCEGVTGLLEREHTGRPSRLSVEQQEILCEILDSGPVAYGFETGLWTAPRIAQVIEAEFHVQYHSHHVCKLLAQLGFSIQRPTRQLAAADPERQQQWVRTTYPALKKGH